MPYTCIIDNKIGKSEGICFRQVHFFALFYHNCFNHFRFLILPEVWM